MFYCYLKESKYELAPPVGAPERVGPHFLGGASLRTGGGEEKDSKYEAAPAGLSGWSSDDPFASMLPYEEELPLPLGPGLLTLVVVVVVVVVLVVPLLPEPPM